MAIFLKSTKGFDFNQDIFKNYPDKKYLKKLSRLNRMLLVYMVEDLVAGVIVLSKKDRFLKINLVLTHKYLRNRKIASALMKVVFNILEDDFSDTDVLYTVCTTKFDTKNYQSFLIKHGFTLSTIKANGELVYTYAKSI